MLALEGSGLTGHRLRDGVAEIEQDHLHPLQLVDVRMFDLAVARELPRQPYIGGEFVGRAEGVEDHVVLRLRVAGVRDGQAGVAVAREYRYLGYVRRCCRAAATNVIESMKTT